MKAYLLKDVDQLGLVDLPMRELARDEIRLKVEACSICGSDLEGLHGIHPKVKMPVVMGHEMASTVVDVGSAVVRFKVGDRVAGSGPVSCGACSACKAGRGHECETPLSPGFTGQGAYAEYFVVRESRPTLMPDDISFEEAAVAQPAGIANHAVTQRAKVRKGEMVLVQGCGPIGLSAMRHAKLAGAMVVSTDIVDYRVEFARRLGADLALNAHRDDVFAAIMDLSKGNGFDKVIECVGSAQDETIPQAVKCVKANGLVTVVGSFAEDKATLPIINFKFNEKEIIGSQGMAPGYEAIFDLVLSGKMDLQPLITHTMSLEDLPHGFELMDDKAESVMKVVVIP